MIFLRRLVYRTPLNVGFGYEGSLPYVNSAFHIQVVAYTAKHSCEQKVGVFPPFPTGPRH